MTQTATTHRLDGSDGRLATSATIVVAGFSGTALVGLLLGRLAVATQARFDEPVYAWLVMNHDPDSMFARLNEAITQLGDPLPSLWQTVAVTSIFVIVFGRRWWIPIVVLPWGFALEFGLQQVLAALIDRESPPLGPGTYFSGGSARFVVIYGLTLFLTHLRWPHLSPMWRILGVALVALVACIMGFTRLYLLTHWPTDVPAGWLLGGLIVLTIVAATRASLPTARAESRGLGRVS